MLGRKILHQIKASTQTLKLNSLVKNGSFYFTKTVKYTPILPLTHKKFNLLYVEENYAKGNILSTRSIFIYFIPALCFTLHTYLTEWSTAATTTGLFVLLFSGLYFYRTSKNGTMKNVLCMQVSSNLQDFYITVPISGKAANLQKSQFLNIDQKPFQLTMEYYHPLFLNPGSYDQMMSIPQKADDAQYMKQNQSKVGASIALHKAYVQFQHQVVRFKITAEQIGKFVFIVKNKEEFNKIEADKKNLSLQDFFKKYQNLDIGIVIKELDTAKNLIFRIKMSRNANKKTHDYLMALALNCKLEPIVKISQSKPHQASSSPQEQQETNQPEQTESTESTKQAESTKQTKQK